VGPGLITGAADDDPSGIATYSQAGAQFGLNMLWTMPVTYPLMAAIQSLCARIGQVTGQGLAVNIKRAFPPWVLYGTVCLLLVANTLNIGADVAAMGQVLAFMIGGNRELQTIGLVATSLLMQVFIPYHRYVKYLKWLTLSLLSYVAVLFTVHVPWTQVAWRTVVPELRLDVSTATVIVGVFGTTISPYLFFWQCSEEVEDLRARRGSADLLHDPAAAPRELRRIRWDTWSGMLYSNLVAFFIILAAAVTLHTAGVIDIQTADQAAAALRPLAGDFAFYLFGLGILGVGAIGVPVLAGSAGYALAEAMGWQAALEAQAKDARGFYAVIGGSMLVGLALGLTPINPIKALFYAAVINGVVAVPLIVVVVLLASNPSVMGRYTANRTSLALGWVTAVALAGAGVVMLIPSRHP
jgi:NRAMP (natural resistance-associated macrophage protein)-like metal ion transporter